MEIFEGANVYICGQKSLPRPTFARKSRRISEGGSPSVKKTIVFDGLKNALCASVIACFHAKKTLAKPCLLCYNLFRMNSGGPLPATLDPDMNV